MLIGGLLVLPFVAVMYLGYLENADKIDANKNAFSVPRGRLKEIKSVISPVYSFVAEKDDLNRIDVVFVNGKGYFDFILFDENDERLYSENFNLARNLNYTPYGFKFGPIADSENKKISFQIVQNGEYGQASVIENEDGEILFQAYYKSDIVFFEYYLRLIGNSFSFI